MYHIPSYQTLILYLGMLTQALAPGADTTLDAAALEAIAGEAPSAILPRDAVVGAALADVAVAAGLQPSKGATRRLIKVRSWHHMSVLLDSPDRPPRRTVRICHYPQNGINCY